MVGDIQLEDLICVLIGSVHYLAAVRTEIPTTDITSLYQGVVELLAGAGGTFNWYTEQLSEPGFSQSAVEMDEIIRYATNGLGVLH